MIVAAVLAAGCGHHERPLSAADRKLCEAAAAQAAPRGSETYEGIYDDCVHNLEHPARGGG